MKNLLVISALAAVASAHAVNLIPNGDFESGVSNFTSDYTLATDLQPELTYNVGANPHDFHPSWSSFGAESGSKMLIVNGVPSGNTTPTVWKGDTLSLTAGSYEFSFYGASSYSANPANINVSLNNVSLGNSGVFSSTTGEFHKYTFGFTTLGGASTFRLADALVQPNGNDFVIDNISLVKTSPVPEPSSIAALAVGAVALLRRRNKRA